MGLGAYVAVSAALFALGIVTIITRRNVIYILMGIEMILNAANINFVAFNRFGSLALDGQMFAIFVIILAAAPCTAMVFVWSQLSDGDPAYTLVQVTINDLVMLVAFAPIVKLLVSGAAAR